MVSLSASGNFFCHFLAPGATQLVNHKEKRMLARRTWIAHLLKPLLGASLMLPLLFASGAKALQTFDIDPGPIGGPANDFSWESDFDQYTLDIVFTDGKALEWGPGTQTFRLLSAIAQGQDFFGAFLDAAGDPILGTAFVGVFGTDLSPANVAVVVLAEQVVFHGMRFIAGDDAAPGMFQSAYQLRWTEVSGAPTVVPEPSTALLFGMGLVGLGLARRRGDDPQPPQANEGEGPR